MSRRDDEGGVLAWIEDKIAAGEGWPCCVALHP